MIVRDLTTGKDTSFGNIGEYAWQNDERSHLLALTISAEGRPATASTCSIRRRQSSACSIRAPRITRAQLAREERRPGRASSETDDKKTGSTHALAWRQLGDSAGKRVEFDPTAAAGVPAGMRTVSFRRPSWSEDGKVIFVGLAKWEDKPPTPSRGRGAGSSQANTTSEGATPPAGGEGSTTPQRPAGGSGAAAEADEAAAVDIWHWNDVDVMAKQKLTATADRRRNYVSAWHLDTNRFVQLGKTFTEQVAPTTRPNVAFVEEWATYAMDRSIAALAADLFVIDLTTGARTKIKDRVDDRRAGQSDGGYVLFLEDDHYWTIDLSRAPSATSRSPWRRRSSIASRTPRSNRSRHSASPAGRKTMRPWCCMTSSTSGRWRRTGRARRV